jgi:ABC-type Fe3+/spermidine/putrescine transport system ATPase subunit
MISVSGLGIRLGNFNLKNISLYVDDGKCLTIIGPNGSGKTILLECIAGLHRPLDGRILVDEVEVTNLPPEKRRIGYVPQDFMLFPHLTADQNVAFGLRDTNGKRVDEARKIMHLLGIEHLVERDVRTLSAGEKQKVALARALAVNPKGLLLDEPLSALDPLARRKLQKELKSALTEILHTLDLPVIYVTHDLLEAQVMSDQIAVMNNGSIEQVGSRDEVLENPRSKFVAEFLGFNVFDGRVISVKDNMAFVEVEGIVIQAEGNDVTPGEDVTVFLKPQDVFLSSQSEGSKPKWQHCQCNIIKGSITEICRTGPLARIAVDAGIPLWSEIGASSLDEFDIEMGSTVYVQFKASRTKMIRKRDDS